MNTLLRSFIILFAINQLLAMPSLAQTQPINERWIGTWQRGDKPLIITSTHFDGCVWGAKRGKACDASYSGTIKKSDLMKNSFNPADKSLIVRLSDDTFRTIERGDRGNPMERESGSYMIYDQGYIYEIGFSTEGMTVARYSKIN